MTAQLALSQPSELKQFRAKVQLYCRLADRTQYDLAAALGLAYPSLNKKLTGQRSLSRQEVKQIITALAAWQSFDRFEQVSELLQLAGYTEPGLDWLFNSEERQRLLIEAPPAPAQDKSNVEHRDNLPQVASSFVGRQAEMATIRELLARSRLVTLVGAGGCGKTRLAIEAARQLVPTYRGGVWLIELANLSSGDLIPKTIAVALGVREQRGQPLVESLTRALKSYGPTVLVVDNCEHLLSATSHLATELLKACPELTVVTTSREKLGSEEEVVFEVGPLQTPPVPISTPTRAAQTGAFNLTELRRYEAVRLFEERARQSLVSFKLERTNAAAVRDICVELDGIPLALELAASRLEALSVNQLRARLGERFRLLSRDQGRDQTKDTASDSAARRHQTLRTLFDWSYELLSPAEQALFCQLGLFVGGCTLPAAQTVVDVSDLDIAGGLESLTLKNLVRPQVDKAGQRRYTMLQTVQQYAVEKLNHYPNLPALKSRYWAYFLELVETLAPRLNGAEQTRAYQQLDSDYANVRQVFRQLIEAGEGKLAGRLGAGLGSYWQEKVFWSEGRNYLEQVLPLISAEPRAQGKVLNWLGTFYWSQGDNTQAAQAFEHSLSLSRQLEDLPQFGAALVGLGKLEWARGNYLLAQKHFEENLELQRKLKDLPAFANAFTYLGNIHNYMANYSQSLLYIKEGLALFQELGDEIGVAASLHNLGAVSVTQGELEQGRQYYEECLTFREKIEDWFGIATTAANLGGVLTQLGDYSKALIYYEKSLNLLKDSGDRRNIATIQYSLGIFYKEQHLYEQGWQFFEESLALRRVINDRRGIALSLNGLADVAEAEGNYQQATQLLIEALGLACEVAEPYVICDNLFILIRLLIHLRVSSVALLSMAAKIQGALLHWHEQANRRLSVYDQRISDEVSQSLTHRLGETDYKTNFAEGSQWSLQEAAQQVVVFEVHITEAALTTEPIWSSLGLD